MKHLLLLFLLLPVIGYTQDNTGTLKVRKDEPLQAYTSIAGITKGDIHINKLIHNPELTLHTNKPGKLVSFYFGYASDNFYKETKVHGERLPLSFIQKMKEHKPKRFYIGKMVALIDGKEVRLPNFSLNLIY